MKRLATLLSMLLLLLVLPACAPGTSPITSPTFRLIPEGSGLYRLEPPGVGSGAAVFRFNLEVTNPNPFGLNLAALDFDLAVNGRRAASSTFTGGVSLAPQGSSQLMLDVSVPIAEGVQLLGDLARLLAGEPTRYTIAGSAAVDILGTRQRLPRTELASGEIRQPLALVVPEVRFNAQASGLREFSLNRAVIDVELEIVNPGPIGYVLRAPDLTLDLAGARIGTGELVSAPVGAFATTPLTLRFEANPLNLGAAVANQLSNLAGGGGIQVAVVGGFSLDVPGITSQNVPAHQLVSGVLR